MVRARMREHFLCIAAATFGLPPAEASGKGKSAVQGVHGGKMAGRPAHALGRWWRGRRRDVPLRLGRRSYAFSLCSGFECNELPAVTREGVEPGGGRDRNLSGA